MKVFQTKGNLILAIIILFAILKFFIIVSFNNTGWEPDSYQHVNELNTVYADFPNNLEMGLNVWSKPLYTFTLGLFSGIFGTLSLIAYQILNLIIMSFAAFVLYTVVQKSFYKFHISLISVLFFETSFLLFRSSLSALTEPVFLIALLLGIFYSQQAKYKLASLLFGIAVLGRIEGLLFLGLFFLWYFYISYKTKFLLLLKKLFTVGIIGILPVFIWNFLGFLQTDKLFFIFQQGYPTNSEELYGTGSWFHFPISLTLHEGILFGLGTLGLLTLFFTQSKTINKKLLILLASFFYIFLFTQIVFWKFGLFGSAGLIRYFIATMPFLIILSASFLNWAEEHSFTRKIIQKNNSYKFIFLALIIVAQIILTSIHFVGLDPIIASKKIKLEHESYRIAGEWIKDNDFDTLNLASDRPEIIYYAGRNLENSTISVKTNYFLEKDGLYAFSNAWGESSYGLSKEAFLKLGNVLYEDSETVIIERVVFENR